MYSDFSKSQIGGFIGGFLQGWGWEDASLQDEVNSLN
jgi:hypothetical protein